MTNSFAPRATAAAVFALAAATAAATPSLAASLLVNGDFEQPAMKPAGVTVYGAGSGLPGWTVVGPKSNAVQLLDNAYAETNALFNAESGQTSMDLSGGGNSGPTSGIEQTVDTIVGHKYRLTFWVGNQDGAHNGNYALPSTVNLSIGGGPLTAFTNADITANRINWRQESIVFQALGDTTAIGFFNGTGQRDAETGLDNVRLTAVPEPATWALMIGGFGLVGSTLRRCARWAVS